jgi:hypothetical protein
MAWATISAEFLGLATTLFPLISPLLVILYGWPFDVDRPKVDDGVVRGELRKGVNRPGKRDQGQT